MQIINGQELSIADFARVWDQIVIDKVVHMVFYRKQPTFDEFYHHFSKQPDFYIVLDENNLYAVSWLTEQGGNKAFAHHVFFKAAWGKKSVEIGKKVVDMYHERFGVIMGLTPITNRLAVRFAKKLGFTFIGEIPEACFVEKEGKAVDGLISYHKKDIAHGGA